ncbi:AAA family ATPase [Enterococcus faecalis]|uniref:AAA family ATPase n=1 Tax=Enterococcus faecalis TaxID=1351 RepID=UPI0035C95791
MLLKQIKIKKLFGLYNHEVILYDDGISIIIGENGIGKTYILNIINSFFNMNFGYFKNIDYEEIEFYFSDDVVWKIKNIEDEEIKYINITSKRIDSEYEGSEESLEKSVNIRLDVSFTMAEQNIRKRAIEISKLVPHLERVNPVKYFDEELSKMLKPNEVIDYYSDYLTENDPFISQLGKESLWVMERIKENTVYLIETQRVYSLVPYDDNLYGSNRSDIQFTDAITKYALDLKTKIIDTDNLYSKESSMKDESFPYRLINKIRNEKVDTSDEYIEKISDKLIALDHRRTEMKKLGLLVNEDSKRINKSDIDLAQEAIELYIEDSNNKFDVYVELQEKIKLFTDVINKRFNNKEIRINKQKGFIFVQTIQNDEQIDEKEIPIHKLSSGEKNELIMFYELLFKSNNETLVLIDEPEISLHISWQTLFIEDLKSIHKITGTNVLIATHSPDIIGSNWELRNDLGGGVD